MFSLCIHLGVLCVFSAPLRLNSSLFAFARSAEYSLASANSALAIVQRWNQASQPLHVCHFGSLSRATRHAKMSIRRFLGGFPPAISADKLHSLQFVHFATKESFRANQKESISALF